MAKRKSKTSARAARFAREYVDMTEALMQQGVPEDVARGEARIAATTMLMEDESAPAYDPADGPCPTCRRG